MVARALKTRYVWIDSLCIMQDDQEDRKREPVLMAIYTREVVSACLQQVLCSSGGLFPLEAYNKDL